MKLHNLAIIFIIIILPMLIILSSYISAAGKTLGLQTEYDEKLNKSTYDAIKVFQMNTLSSSTSDLADSKIRDIKASVNIFYNSLKNNFSMNGYEQEDLQLHVPAIVYGMYDGYYIYSPYHNTCEEDGTYNENGEIIFDLKPYVYYSCRYVKDITDVVITYSLDNYVTIRGKVGDKIVDLKGYLLSSVDEEGGYFKYRGISGIGIENNVKEMIIDPNRTSKKSSLSKNKRCEVL